MHKFSIEEFRQYVLSQDSLGDVLYNLTEENVEKANEIPDWKEIDEFEIA